MDKLDAAADPLVTVDIATDGAGIPIVTIAGELDIGNIETVDTVIAPLLSTRPARLIVDVGELRFADSSAIALWVRWASSVDAFELRNPQPLLRKVIKMMGLAEKIELDATQARTFPADPQSVSAARRFVVEVLSGSPPDLLDAVELMVSELATNVVGHVQTSFELTLSRTAQEIRVEVGDRGGGTPAIQAPGPDDPRGRGLRIVDGLADRWGVEYDPPAGKIVWFTLAVPAADTVR